MKLSFQFKSLLGTYECIILQMFLDTIKNGKMVDKSIITNIWECLEKISNENVQCCICGVSLPRNFQNKIENTVILEEHLLKIHNIQSFESCGLD